MYKMDDTTTRSSASRLIPCTTSSLLDKFSSTRFDVYVNLNQKRQLVQTCARTVRRRQSIRISSILPSLSLLPSSRNEESSTLSGISPASVNHEGRLIDIVRASTFFADGTYDLHKQPEIVVLVIVGHSDVTVSTTNVNAAFGITVIKAVGSEKDLAALSFVYLDADKEGRTLVKEISDLSTNG
ncbi:hypothetical protein BJV77DRAFT_966254 [Russula vinacea]|nr:hypothetical protein BJV77DRAFT_966254 [Russula vinacea]